MYQTTSGGNPINLDMEMIHDLYFWKTFRYDSSIHLKIAAAVWEKLIELLCKKHSKV